MNRHRFLFRIIGATLAGAVIAGGIGPAQAQQATTGDEAEIRGVIDRFYQAYAKEDLTGLKSLWSARVPGLNRLMAAFEPTIKGRDFTFADVSVSRVNVESLIASARVTVDATVVDSGKKLTVHEKWVRNFTFVKDPEGWRVWRDAPAAEDVAIEIRSASSAAQAAAIIDREPDLMTGEISQALFGLGNRLRQSGRADEAQDAYRLSEQVAERSGDPIVMAQSYTNAGVNNQIGGHPDRALEFFQRALSLYEKSGDKARIAGGEANVASALYLLKRYPEAIAQYQAALARYESVGEKTAVARTWHSIGNAQYLANDYGAALESYRSSLAILESEGDVLGAANTLQAVGMVLKEQGDYDASLEAYTASLARHDKYGNTAGIAVVEASLGDVHRLMGDRALALEWYFKALPLLEQIGDREAVASTLVDIAGVYSAERRYPQALEYFAKGLPIFEKNGNKAEAARTMAGIGAVYFAQAKFALAMEQYQKSLSIFQEIDRKAGIAWAQVHIGLVHQAEGRFAEAESAFAKGLAIAEELKDRPSVAIALALVARARASLDRPHEALAVAKQAAATAAEVGELDTLGRARLVAGEISVQLEQTADAQQSFADAAVALEQLQAQGAGADRDRFFADTLAPFLALVRLAVADNRPEDALAWLERGKAYLLRNIIGGTGALVTRGMTDTERTEEHSLARRITSLATQVKREQGREKPDQPRMERLQADLEKTRLDQAAFARALDEAHPYLKVLRGRFEPVAFGEKATLPLPAAAVVIEYAVGEKETSVFVVKGAVPAGVSVKAFTLDVKAADLAVTIAQFHGLILKKDQGVEKAARALYDLLLKPAEGAWAGATELVIVPDAVLWALPFQALQPRDGRYLIEDRAVSYAPSLAAFVEMARVARDAAERGSAMPTASAFGVAAPGQAAADEMTRVRPDVKIDAAPEAPKEAAAVAGVYGAPRGKTFSGEAATTAAFRGETPRTDALHLAVPGLLNDSSPMTSRLAFAPGTGDKKDDGLLETWELMGIESKARVLFFSRLQGEPSQARAGDGAVGLAWATFVAGAPATVVTAWAVDAPSATTIAVAFHRRMAAVPAPGGPPRTAPDVLRRATLGLLAVPATRPPYYWAGFSVFGR